MMKIEIKGIFIKTLLIILAISFVLFGIINFFSGVGTTNVAKIADKNVSLMQFSRFLTEKRNQFFKIDINNKDLDYLNSREFINDSLREYIADLVVQNKIAELDLYQPKEVAIKEIMQNPNFKGTNGKFDIKLFNDILSQNRLSESVYVHFVSMYGSKNNLMQLITPQKLNNNFITEKIFKNDNKYIVADIIEIKPENLNFDYKKPTNDEIKQYYDEHKDTFLVPEEKIISFIEVDLSGYGTEEAKSKLSNLEDLVLSSNSLDEISKAYNVKKNSITYSKGDDLPQDLTLDILQYNAGTFSDVIYKDNNIYKVYFMEKIVPAKILTFDEAKGKISKILVDKAKKENELVLIDKIVRQIKTNNISKVAQRNGLLITKNKTIYKNNIDYPENFIVELFELKELNSFTKPIFDEHSNVYLLGLLKNTKEIAEDNSNFVKYDLVESIINRSYKNSIYRIFEKYLFDNTKIIINNKLMNTLE